MRRRGWAGQIRPCQCGGPARTAMNAFLFSPPAIDPPNTTPVGPKAANLPALARAGLPTPGGFAITADAYRRQIEHLGLAAAIGEYDHADQPAQRRLAVEIRLQLYQSELAPDLVPEVLAAWRTEQKPT